MKRFLMTSRLFTKLGVFAAAVVFVLLTVGLFSRSTKTVTAEMPRRINLAQWNQEPQISAAKRGNPWINVEDGREILLDFEGVSMNEQSRPLSLVAADFDEDGTPDIIAGYAADDQRGVMNFMRGNVDAVYPNAPEAGERKSKGEFTDAPFLSPARLFSLSVAPDFLAAGDFDADGHFDVAAAARNEAAVYFLSGDGRGEFVLSKRVELPGKVTALLGEDFNRRDGINDLIVAVRTERDAQVLIYENPYGAMKAQPEIFTFAAPVKSLATGLLEGDARFDLAIAAGDELAILRGRDRKLLLDASGKSAERLQITRRRFDFEIDALAIGEFLKSEIFKNEIALLDTSGTIHLLEKSEPPAVAGGLTASARNLISNESLTGVQPPATAGGSDLWRDGKIVSMPENLSNENAPVMLTARVSARSVDTLIVGAGSRIHLLTSDITPLNSETETINYDAQEFNLAASLDVASLPTAILPMRLNIDALSDLVVLREDSVAPIIVQSAPMATFTIESNGNTPDPDLSDGTCKTPPLVGGMYMGPCTYLSAREQANFSSGSHLINFAVPVMGTPTFLTPQIGIFRPLTIDGTTQAGGFVEFTGVSNAFPATHYTGSQTDNCVFRGIIANGFVGGNSYINLQSDNHIVEGNRIGTNVAGTAVPAATGGNAGVNSSGEGNLIGGTTAAARNIISTADTRGVTVGNNAPAGNPNRLQGNYIGTDITGSVSLGNRFDGLRMSGANILVGATTAGAGNVISATTGDANFGANGIFAPGGCAGCGPGNLIQGNRIGTNAAGTAALGNLRFGMAGNTGSIFDLIGGTVPTARKVISGNGLDGLDFGMSGASSYTPMIVGNYIGTNAAGNQAIPNAGFGLRLSSPFQTVTSGNVISGNTGGGMQTSRFNNTTPNDTISDNLIGTDATGTTPLGNNGVGLVLGSGSGGFGTSFQTVTGNTIAGNTSHGVLIDGGTSLILQSNFIGTNSNLSQNLANGGDGIRFINQFRQNQIGGAGAGNTIAFNAGNGVNLPTTNIFADQNRITHNSIVGNGGLGIDLSGNGVTPNDNCDGENGPNTLQNYPVISAISASGASSVRIVGRLNSTANQTFTLHFYANPMSDASGFGEGQAFIGTANVSTPAGCQANFSATLPFTLFGTRCVSATATDALGNTSEFSNCAQLKTPTGDFDNDGLADLAVWRPSNGIWFTLQSSNGAFSGVAFGQMGDRPAPGDFDGNGRMDYTVFRPSNGVWYQLFNPALTFRASPWGINTDLPIPGDFNGDGIDDITVWRGSDGFWYSLLSPNGVPIGTQWGQAGDRPVSGDFDGDGRADLAVYRNGDWFIRNSRNNAVTAINFGISTDRPVAADFDGDGRTDIAVYRPSNGVWYLLQSGSNNSFAAVQFGISTDTPVPADYDGDGRADIAVYRGGTWIILRIGNGGVTITQFGSAEDIPIPAAKLF